MSRPRATSKRLCLLTLPTDLVICWQVKASPMSSWTNLTFSNSSFASSREILDLMLRIKYFDNFAFFLFWFFFVLINARGLTEKNRVWEHSLLSFHCLLNARREKKEKEKKRKREKLSKFELKMKIQVQLKAASFLQWFHLITVKVNKSFSWFIPDSEWVCFLLLIANLRFELIDKNECFINSKLFSQEFEIFAVKCHLSEAIK